MANQGLFTTGPSVEDLLQQRNTDALNLQQQLMQNAAQGARDPAKAQAVSLLGSTLGRALGGSMGGADKQMEERKNSLERQKEMQAGYSTAMTSNDPQKQLAYGNALIQAGYTKEGTDIVLSSKTLAESQQAAADKKEQQRLTNESNVRLADKVKKVLPSISESARNGDPDAIKFIYKYLEDQRKGSEGSDPTADEKNWDRYQTEKKVLDTLKNSPNPDVRITVPEYNRRLRLLEKGMLGYNDPMNTEQAKQDVKGVATLTVANGKIINESTGRIATLDQSLRILDENNAYTGTGADFVLGFKKVLYSFCMSDDEIGIADAEQFRTNGLKFVMEYIQQTKGAVSDAEMKLFAEASPSLLATKGGNRMMLQTALDIAQWNEKKAVHMNEWHMQQQTDGAIVRPTNWAAESRAFDKANQLSLPTSKEIEAAAAGTLLTTSAGKTVVPSDAFLEAEKKYEDVE